MTRLKTLLCAGAAVAAIGLSTHPASAQSVRFSDIDSNGNGRISYQELVSAFGSSAASRMWRWRSDYQLTPGDVGRLGSRWNDDDDDDGGFRWGNDDDDDDDGRGRGRSNDNDDDDDGGRDDDDDDGGNDDDD